MNLGYEITKDKVALINRDGVVFQNQTSYPNGDKWTLEEAKAWAEVLIDSFTNPDPIYLPGDSKVEPTKLAADYPPEDSLVDTPTTLEPESE